PRDAHVAGAVGQAGVVDAEHLPGVAAAGAIAVGGVKDAHHGVVAGLAVPLRRRWRWRWRRRWRRQIALLRRARAAQQRCGEHKTGYGGNADHPGHLSGRCWRRQRDAEMRWWVVLGSNQWPLLCESSALPLS